MAGTYSHLHAVLYYARKVISVVLYLDSFSSPGIADHDQFGLMNFHYFVAKLLSINPPVTV